MPERTDKPAGVKFGDYLRDLIQSRRLDFGIPEARCRALEDWEPGEQDIKGAWIDAGQPPATWAELARAMRAHDAK